MTVLLLHEDEGFCGNCHMARFLNAMDSIARLKERPRSLPARLEIRDSNETAVDHHLMGETDMATCRRNDSGQMCTTFRASIQVFFSCFQNRVVWVASLHATEKWMELQSHH
jgi:hypothetical protein